MSDWRPPPVGTKATWTRTITADDVEAYASITGDRNPLHFDAVSYTHLTLPTN